jgi:signal transduction histidine kinase
MLTKMNALPSAARTASVIASFLAMLAVVGAVAIAILTIGRPSWPVTLWTMAFISASSAILYLIARLGKSAPAGLIAIGVVSAAAAVDSLNPNRTFGLAAPALPLLIVFSAFVYDMRGMALTVAVNALWVIGVTVYKLTRPDIPEYMMRMQLIDALVYLLYFAATACIMFMLNRWVGSAQRQIDEANTRRAEDLQALRHEVATRKTLEAEQSVRANELAKLLEISSSLSSTLELPVLLDCILAKLNSVVAFDEAFIAEFIDTAALDVQIASAAGLYPPSLKGAIWRFEASTDHIIAEVAARQAPIVIVDLTASDDYILSFKQWYVRNYGAPKRPMTSAMLVPLVVKGRTTGLMCLCTSRSEYYSDRLAALAGAFGSQAAAALETVRLHGQALRAAALNERTRLARDLHDSVSQSLYGIVLGARTAKATIQSGAATDQALDYVLRLAESGLTEMRALIFELRPEHLDQDGLLGALEKQVTAICSRHHIRLALSIRAEEPSLPARVKESIYRIVIEATNNAIKHSTCSELRVEIVASSSALSLTVLDNGNGFDTNDTFPRSWGLTGMRERAEDINGVLNIESARGVGTVVALSVPLGSASHPSDRQLELFEARS